MGRGFSAQPLETQPPRTLSAFLVPWAFCGSPVCVSVYMSLPGTPFPTIKMFSDLPAAVGTHLGLPGMFVCHLGLEWDPAMLEHTVHQGKVRVPFRGSTLGKQGGGRASTWPRVGGSPGRQRHARRPWLWVPGCTVHLLAAVGKGQARVSW